MAAFTIQTVLGDLFATSPAIAGGPIQFLAQNNLPNQQWILAPAAAGLTLIQWVDGPGPGFADVVGGGVVDSPVNVGPGANNWFITEVVVNEHTIQLNGAPLFWGLSVINEAILVNPGAAANFNIVPI